ncbi:uncharacterized protein LOC115990956 [Quercus lobata]|uniref:uncharacterized protein LOC115990956 n=1 Tax=Quercus lobata TaxID=97700 RepID=UPI0012468D6E|nr:uncharacterized protein LOC115990956 [Quercus lobata]
MVAELIDPDTRWWDREFIMQNFNHEDGEVILRVPLSRRVISDSLFWTFTKSGEYIVRSGYHVARQLQKEVDWAKSSNGVVGGVVWRALWKLKVPNKIKVFGWRACRNILSTWVNLVHRRIIQDNRCEVCKFEAETGIHALWKFGVARDVWAGCLAHLQKCVGDQADMLQLMEELIGRLFSDELKHFLVQAWIICNEMAYYMGSSCNHLSPSRWRPPPVACFKLNFGGSIFQEGGASGIGVVIRNDRGEVMAALLAKGPPVMCSEEAEILACRSAVEFTVDCGFLELVLEGDN